MAYLWRFGADALPKPPMLARPRPPFPPIAVFPPIVFAPEERFGGMVVVQSDVVVMFAADMGGCVRCRLQRLEPQRAGCQRHEVAKLYNT